MCFICSSCDRGQVYCGRDCSAEARAESNRRAGARYRRSFGARRKAAERQAARRARLSEKVTQQGPPESPPRANVEAAADNTTGLRPVATVIACTCCGAESPRGFVRTSFIRVRGRRLFPTTGAHTRSHGPPT